MADIFHAHVYFDLSSRGRALNLREKAVAASLPVLGISKLIDRSVGPHPIPMFEIDFEAPSLGAMVQWLNENRDSLSVLIHRDRRPEVLEHTVNAIWIGLPQKLMLDALDRDTDVHGDVMPGAGQLPIIKQ